MKHAAPVRRELGDPDGVQPARAADQPGGSPPPVDRRLRARNWCHSSESVLAELGGVERALVVHGAGGVDELTTLGPNTGVPRRGRETYARLQTSTRLRLAFETRLSSPHLAGGGGSTDNAARTRAISRGREQGLASDTVVLNAAAALYLLRERCR